MSDQKWKELYHEKNKHLASLYEQVSPYEFYRDLWPEGSFEREGIQLDQKPNGLALIIKGKGRAHHRIITDGLEQLEDLIQEDFVITSPVSYFGERRTGKNARNVYAMTFDLDGVEMQQLRDLLFQMRGGHLPVPTYIVNSGRGLHLYYFLEENYKMLPHIQAYLKELKYALTRQIWNRYTSTRKDVEVQGILQGFRMIGSPSKMGRDYPVVAFKTGKRVSVEELLEHVPPSSGERERILAALEKNVTLEEAKVKWPEWYQRRIVEGRPRGRWTIKRDLYDWWLRRIRNEIKVGHRFYGIMTLAIYAAKCDIDEDELRRDAYSLLDGYDAMSETEDNRFTADDIETGLTAFLDSYCTFPRDDIAKYSGLSMPENRRNYRKQEDHLRRARLVQSIDFPNGEWRNKEGRPNKQQQVQEWRQENPQGKKADCVRETGLDKKTVYKWW